MAGNSSPLPTTTTHAPQGQNGAHAIEPQSNLPGPKREQLAIVIPWLLFSLMTVLFLGTAVKLRQANSNVQRLEGNAANLQEFCDLLEENKQIQPVLGEKDIFRRLGLKLLSQTCGIDLPSPTEQAQEQPPKTP